MVGLENLNSCLLVENLPRLPTSGRRSVYRPLPLRSGGRGAPPMAPRTQVTKAFPRDRVSLEERRFSKGARLLELARSRRLTVSRDGPECSTPESTPENPETPGPCLSPAGVRGVWQRHDLETRQSGRRRLLAAPLWREVCSLGVSVSSKRRGRALATRPPRRPPLDRHTAPDSVLTTAIIVLRANRPADRRRHRR